jgi:hypothetical protein
LNSVDETTPVANEGSSFGFPKREKLWQRIRTKSQGR